MKVYKWSNLVLKACQCLSSQFHGHRQGIYGLLMQVEQQQTGQPVKPWRENAAELREKAWQTIEQWDIRLAKRLFELFPQIIAKKYRGQTPIADYDEKGDWVIVFNS